MNDVLEVNINKIEDALNKYNYNYIEHNLIDYIYENGKRKLEKNKRIKIKINNKTNENIDLIPLIKKGIKFEYEANLKKHLNTDFVQILYFIIGTIILFISSVVDIGETFKQVIVIGGWVFVWAAVEVEIFNDVKQKRKVRILKKILDSEFIEVKK